MPNIQLQFRRGTAAEWDAANPVLAEGEIGIEKLTYKYKIGNGVLPWTLLPYAGGTGDTGPQGEKGDTGADGLSTYQIALNHGFIGTEIEWLASLKGVDGTNGVDGEDGQDGASAYQIALNNGFVGTEEQWLESLNGADGQDGVDGVNGADGASAYEIAVSNGFAGTEAQWLASLVGADGPQGAPGANGQDGASAYEIAVSNGYTGTEAEWIAEVQNRVHTVTGINGVIVDDTDPQNIIISSTASSVPNHDFFNKVKAGYMISHFDGGSYITTSAANNSIVNSLFDAWINYTSGTGSTIGYNNPNSALGEMFGVALTYGTITGAYSAARVTGNANVMLSNMSFLYNSRFSFSEQTNGTSEAFFTGLVATQMTAPLNEAVLYTSSCIVVCKDATDANIHFYVGNNTQRIKVNTGIPYANIGVTANIFNFTSWSEGSDIYLSLKNEGTSQTFTYQVPVSYLPNSTTQHLAYVGVKNTGTSSAALRVMNLYNITIETKLNFG